MSCKENDIYQENLYLQIAELGGIWYRHEESLEEALEKTSTVFGRQRKNFAILFDYSSKDGVIYEKQKPEQRDNEKEEALAHFNRESVDNFRRESFRN